MTRTYKIYFAPRVEKQLKAIPQKIRDQIMERINRLSINPRPSGMEPLQGLDKDSFRIRQGDYRIVYSIQDEKLMVLLLRVVKRGEVYAKKHSGKN